jgi:hypothetical protein
MPIPATFAPRWPAQSISVTTTSASATLNTGYGDVLRLYNAGSATIFIRVTTGAGTALTTDLAMPAGAIETFTIGGTDDTVSAITASGSATLYINQGEGL